MQTNPQLELATNYVLYTGQNIFLTGKAGTGKTTFLHRLREISSKRMIVVAPTGVAAVNARGVTIHSFFQLSFGMQIGLDRMKQEQMRFSKEKINIIRSLDLLVIDEISMVRADLLDAVDAVLRRFRTQSKPFGGVQLLMIGDLQQLSPVVKDDEREMLKEYYDTPYFFSSKALCKSLFVSIELTHVYRQHDDIFISILNKVRENKLDKPALEILNRRYIPDFQPKENEDYITLCTHNAQAQRINDSKINSLKNKKYCFTATIEGNFPEYAYPTDFELYLKENAQVMFVKNDSSPEKRFYNGKVGKITYIDEDTIRVLCRGDEEEISVSPQQWDNVKYSLDEVTSQINETIEGSFTQFPLKLAWAITIHKSQGLTFERAIIDAQASFAHGQVYVALSRCKTLEGMVLSTPIYTNSIINDHTVSGFTQSIEQNQPDENRFRAERMAYQHELLKDLFLFATFINRISYIQKIINENKGSIAAITSSAFREMLPLVQTDIIDVANRFLLQINKLLSAQPDVEQNAALQNRISQAAVYFSEKIKMLLLEPVSKIDLELDNKAVKKQLQSVVNNLEDDSRVKYESLRSCIAGFNLADFLKAKALASIQKEKPKEPRKFTAIESNEIEYPVLFNRLRVWRMAKAEELNLPAYSVFSQKALYELVRYLPVDSKSLLQINGIGKKKISQFGEGIIEIIKDFCKENSIK
ncbi:MAG: AAA family ATPase [Dysgonamonadaceae bacterium]|jgi:hypothetical protein|nr:AAA family ATPase [Dysgonamonadaceae bacterium]